MCRPGISFMLWFEVLAHGVKYLQSGNWRQRAESDLYGRSELLGRMFLRRLRDTEKQTLSQFPLTQLRLSSSTASPIPLSR